MTKTLLRPHTDAADAASTVDALADELLADERLEDEVPQDEQALRGESTLAESPFPTAEHLDDIEQRAGLLHLEGQAALDHERLSTRPEEVAARALEHELESGASLAEEERERREDLATDEILSVRERPKGRR